MEKHVKKLKSGFKLQLGWHLYEMSKIMTEDEFRVFIETLYTFSVATAYELIHLSTMTAVREAISEARSL